LKNLPKQSFEAKCERIDLKQTKARKRSIKKPLCVSHWFRDIHKGIDFEERFRETIFRT